MIFFLSIMYVLVNIYVLTRLFKWLGIVSKKFKNLWLRGAMTLTYAFFMFSPLLAFLVEAAPYHRTLKIIGNYWLGIFLFTVIVTTSFSLVGFILSKIWLKDREKNRRIYRISGFICIAVIASMTIYASENSGNIRVKNYNITVNKDVEQSREQMKVILISDTHLGYSIGNKQMGQMVEKINEQEADLVVLTGDIFDNNYSAMEDPRSIEKTLKRIKSKYGVYACWGNHDIPEVLLSGFTLRSKNRPYKKDERFVEFLKNSNITLLEDESVKIDNSFYLIGRKDYSMAQKLKEKRKTVKELTDELDKNFPIFMMDHQPKNLREAQKAGVDLALSGHTHGGQVFPGNLTVKIPWENPYGVLKKGDMSSCVTSGVGVWGPNMRLGSNTEIMVLNIKFNRV